jgi:hypothetical protein
MERKPTHAALSVQSSLPWYRDILGPIDFARDSKAAHAENAPVHCDIHFRRQKNQLNSSKRSADVAKWQTQRT